MLITQDKLQIKTFPSHNLWCDMHNVFQHSSNKLKYVFEQSGEKIHQADHCKVKDLGLCNQATGS